MNVTNLGGRLTITVPEAAELLGIGRGAAYAAAGRGEIPTLHLGRRLVVPVASFLELVGVRADGDQPPASARDGDDDRQPPLALLPESTDDERAPPAA